MQVILEGCDLVGKSTAIRLISGMFPIQDRLLPFSECIHPSGVDFKALDEVVQKNLDKLFIVLYVANGNLLLRRLALRPNPDQYDLECVRYNDGYIEALGYLEKRGFQNIRSIEVGGLNKFEKTAKIFETYIRYVNPTEVERT